MVYMHTLLTLAPPYFVDLEISRFYFLFLFLCQHTKVELSNVHHKVGEIVLGASFLSSVISPSLLPLSLLSVCVCLTFF